MKRNRWINLIGVLLSCAFLLALTASLTQAQDVQPPVTLTAALGTGFTYQGQLKKGSTLITGSCDFQFSLWDAEASGSPIGSTTSADPSAPPSRNIL